ncbi:MAG: type II secretion system protein GspD [Gammaproteobacteria bacterium]|nr:MAG: type II secretion system protein GspD [Gammaproteobacteria bacterium]
MSCRRNYRNFIILIIGLLLTQTSWAKAKPVTLNLKNADIRSVITTISDITGKNFIIDPRVKGKVTIISAKPMSKDAVYQVFLSLLQVHGFSAVPGPNAIKILPEATAKQYALPTAANRTPGRNAEMVTRVLEIKHVPAVQLVPILRPLIPQQGHMAAYSPSNILIISDHADNIRRLEKIIAGIDKPEGNELEIIPLKNASASEVVKVLNALTNSSQNNKQPNNSRPILVADERTNSIIIGGDKSSRLRIRSIIVNLDTPLESEGNIRVVYLHYAEAKELATILTGIKDNLVKEAQGKKQGSNLKAAEVSNSYIQADEGTNSLVISAPPDLYQSLLSVIRQLDVRRAQVVVEAIIAEVSSNKSAELGIQWAVLDQSAGNNTPVGITDFGDTSLGGILSGLASGTAPSSVPNGLTTGIGRFARDGLSFAALLRALSGDGGTNVLATPTLITMDNSEAEIVVGQNVPFITGSFTSTGGGSNPTNPFTTIERQDVGLTLKVKPQINEGSTVKMDIKQEVSNVDFSADSSAGFITNKRSINTTVMVEDQHIVILGGLIQDDLKETVQRVPILGSIPILGAAFRYNKTVKTKNNLMVFLRPRIIRHTNDGLALTADRYNYIRAQQLEHFERGVPLMKRDVTPILPDLNIPESRPGS